MTAYYNENDPVAAHVLRCLIEDGIIAPGIVDERSIKEVEPHDLRDFAQCHFFAGAGTWSVAARLAGWADERPLWTASCPCQPFSAAGKGNGTDDPRHLWPDVFRLIRGAKAGGFGPAVLMGEQVSGKAGYGWFDGVRADLAQEGYASRARDIPALAVDGPHQRNRLYWIAVADADAGGRAGWTEGAERSPEQRVVAEWPADEYLADRHQPVGLEQQQAGQQPLVQHHARDDGGRDAVEHAKGERRREGRPEHELRSGRSTLASADVSGVRKNRNNQARYHRIRREVLAHYSGGDIKCACCGEHQFEFLALDHINGGGNAEKQRVGSRMRFRHLQLAGYPEGYQVLCHNCNQAKHIYGECPHRSMGDAFRAGLEGHTGHGDERFAECDRLDGRRGTGWSDGPEIGNSHDARRNGSFWADAEWIICHDGKARRTKPGIPLLAHGVAGRIHKWRLVGNSIVVPQAVEVIRAMKEVLDGQ